MKNFFNSNKNYDYIDETLLNAPKKEPKVKFFVTDDALGYDTLQSVKVEINRLKTLQLDTGTLDIDAITIKEEDWINNFKKHFKPLHIGKNIVVRPSWEDYNKKQNQIVFTIEPGHLFGTGMHQSTQLCIEMLEKYINNKSNLLDIGCGTGILSIIAKLLGANAVVAVDIEKAANKIVKENMAINNVADIEIYTGDLLDDKELAHKLLAAGQYNIITINIVANIIISMLDFISNALKNSKNIIIASGIIDERTSDVLEAFANYNFDILEVVEKDNWVCIVGAKI